MPGSARLVAFAVLCAAVWACEPPTDPLTIPPRRLVIHLVLDAATVEQAVKVQWSDSGGRRLTYVSGAEITLTTPNGDVFRGEETFRPISGTRPEANYRISGLGVNTVLRFVPGGTYTLNVRTPTGEEVSGTTTMPQFESIATGGGSVVQPFVRERDTVRLTWPRMPLAKRYEVDVHTFFVIDTITVFARTYSVFADTSITIAGTARTLADEAVFEPGTSATIQVVAVDDNYYTYYHPNVDPFAGAPPSRLKGAVGVFGAVVPVLIRTYQDVR